ncbi:MAG: radical SAM protein [Planctomycetota bacterium]|nr:MAG: radical SAM protein [Planctomycetota bacterium]
MLQVSDLIEATRRGGRASLRFPKERFGSGPRPPVVVWNVVRHCNMCCPHCYAAASSRPSPTDLSTSEALRVLDSIAAAGVRVLIFSGGEPLLRPDLFFLMDKARRLGLRPHLSTNGSLIDSEAARRLVDSGVVYVGVSIDGPADFNDLYRGLPGGFERAVRALRLARAAGLRTGLRLTLMRDNRQYLEEVYATAREVGANRFYVSHLIGAGRARGLADQALSRAEARASLRLLFALAERGLDEGWSTRVVTGSNDSDGPFLLRWLRERYGARADVVAELLLRRGGNSAGEGLLNIDARGRVHPDQFWQEAVLGDVRTDRFEDILAHPLRTQLARRSDALCGRCGGCAYLDLCRGSHRGRALAAHGDPWASDPACVLEDSEISVPHSQKPLEAST